MTPTGEDVRCHSAVPVFLVADVDATAQWYAERLDFQTAGRFPRRPPAAWASLQRDGAEIMLQRLDGYRKAELYGRRAGGVWDVYVRLRGVKELYESLREQPFIKMAL